MNDRKDKNKPENTPKYINKHWTKDYFLKLGKNCKRRGMEHLIEDETTIVITGY